MDPKAVKKVLHAWRASGADAGDPLFAEPLTKAASDPELAAWFEQEQALDRALARKLRELPVPEALRNQILAQQPDASPATMPRFLVPLALAAALAILATLAAFWTLRARGDGGFASYQAQMVDKLAELQLDFAGPRLAEVQDWLASHRGLSSFNIPDAMEGLPTVGCKTWSWNGKPVALICFSLNDGRVVHLFVVPGSALPDALTGGEPQFAGRAGWMTACWSADGNQYMAVQRGDEAALRRVLGIKG